MTCRKCVLAVIAAAATAGTAIQPVLAQGYYGAPQPYPPPPPYSYDQRGYDDQRAYQQGLEDHRRAEEQRRAYEQQQREYQQQAQYGYNPYGTPPAIRCEQKRESNTAGGAILGAIAGGLLGNSVSRDRGAGTAIGAIAGGVLGASIGRSLSCQNQQYAYNVYYSGFEAGRPHHRYEWRSPYDSSYGYMDVADYYTGPEGYRCANYTQRIWVNGRPEVATGHACRRPDGTWQMVG